MPTQIDVGGAIVDVPPDASAADPSALPTVTVTASRPLPWWVWVGAGLVLWQLWARRG